MGVGHWAMESLKRKGVWTLGNLKDVQSVVVKVQSYRVQSPDPLQSLRASWAFISVLKKLMLLLLQSSIKKRKRGTEEASVG